MKKTTKVSTDNLGISETKDPVPVVRGTPNSVLLDKTESLTKAPELNQGDASPATPKAPTKSQKKSYAEILHPKALKLHSPSKTPVASKVAVGSMGAMFGSGEVLEKVKRVLKKP